MLRRLRLPALTTVLALTTLAACGGNEASAGPDDTDDTDATDDTGAAAGEAVLLGATDGAEVGQAVEQDLTMTMTMSGEGEEFEIVLGMTTQVEIVSVEDDGGYRTESVIISVEQRGGDSEAGQVVEQLEPITDVAMTVDVAADGQPGAVEFADDAPPEAQALMSQFGASITGPPISFPDEPVAVGDEWSEEVEISSSGMSLPLEMNYELVALDDESYTIEVDYGGDLDQSGVTGEISASGTITGSRSNPLLLDSEVESVSEVEGDGMSLSQRFDVVVESEPAAG